MFSRQRYILFGLCSLLVAGGGLYIGKMKEKDFVGDLYARTDFTLLDDANDFFRLGALPKGERLLLVFTPDGIPPEDVPAFFAFGKHLPDFQKQHIQVVLITRTNKEIVANFKRVSRFNGKVLYDLSGTVGRTTGVWPTLEPVSHWGYVLVDNVFNQYWAHVAPVPATYEEINSQLPK